MRRAVTALALGLLLASPVAAHEFWVQPDRYVLAPGGETPLTLQVGTGAERQRSQMPLRRITRFVAIGPDGSEVDLKPSLGQRRPADDGVLKPSAPGTYVVLLQTDDAAQNRLPAERFNAYLEDEGLTPALEFRQRTQRTGAEGSEIYSRQTKALVQVGEGSGSQATRPIGMALEIVPEASPYASPRPASLPVRVLYEGRPLAGALVKLFDQAHDAQPLDARRTDAAGRAGFAMPATGTWLLAVIWTKPRPAGADTDFETVFSSLSFGVAP